MLQRLEGIAAGTVAARHLANSTGDGVFRVLKHDIKVSLTPRLHLDQVAKAQGFILVAISDHQVEIGADHGRLVTVGGLEGDRLDTITRCRLLFGFAVTGGIDKLDLGATIAGYRILLEKILDPGYQRRQQGVGLGREVAADQQWLLQRRELVLGGFGEAVLLLRSDIRAGPADGIEPEVGGDEIGRRQSHGPAPKAMPRADGIACPTQPLE